MHTIIVWVMIATMWGEYGSARSAAPIIVDNIATQEDCQALAASVHRLHETGAVTDLTCIAVRKRVP